MKKEKDQIIDYKVVYSRRRSIGISIGPDSGVIVRAPYRTSLKTIENLVISKSNWIIKHLENYKSAIRTDSNKVFTAGVSILFRGKEYQIKIIKSTTYFVNLNGNIIEIGLRNIEERDMVAKLIVRWYKSIAERIFRSKFEEILVRFKNYNFAPSEFSVRALKRRWGSCTSKGKITLSSELVKLDDIYLEYVMLHELCHLKHHNHSQEYYKLLTELFPEWKQRRKELRRYIR